MKEEKKKRKKQIRDVFGLKIDRKTNENWNNEHICGGGDMSCVYIWCVHTKRSGVYKKLIENQADFFCVCLFFSFSCAWSCCCCWRIYYSLFFVSSFDGRTTATLKWTLGLSTQSTQSTIWKKKPTNSMRSGRQKSKKNCISKRIMTHNIFLTFVSPFRWFSWLSPVCVCGVVVFVAVMSRRLCCLHRRRSSWWWWWCWWNPKPLDH